MQTSCSSCEEENESEQTLAAENAKNTNIIFWEKMFSSETKQASGKNLHELDGTQMACSRDFFFFGTTKE